VEFERPAAGGAHRDVLRGRGADPAEHSLHHTVPHDDGRPAPLRRLHRQMALETGGFGLRSFLDREDHEHPEWEGGDLNSECINCRLFNFLCVARVAQNQLGRGYLNMDGYSNLGCPTKWIKPTFHAVSGNGGSFSRQSMAVAPRCNPHATVRL
jgi:hypothetical protein